MSMQLCSITVCHAYGRTCADSKYKQGSAYLQELGIGERHDMGDMKCVQPEDCEAEGSGKL